MPFPLTLPAATAPSSEPALREGLDPASVTPGTLGFLATLFVVIGVFLLIRDMTKRIRRVRYNSVVEEARVRAAEDAAGPGDDGGPGAAPSGGRIPDPPRDRSHGVPPVPGGAPPESRPVPGGKHGPDAR